MEKKEAGFLGMLDPRESELNAALSRPAPGPPRASRSRPTVLTRLESQAGAVFVAHGGHAVSGLHVQQDLVVLRGEQRGSELQTRPPVPRAGRRWEWGVAGLWAGEGAPRALPSQRVWGCAEKWWKSGLDNLRWGKQHEGHMPPLELGPSPGLGSPTPSPHPALQVPTSSSSLTGSAARSRS